eukprot:GHVU01091591.1.p1 GENE.GHVU01091591.1~~GHVU01091591.1.p1  ORF type:complete len:148 (+),score=17.13 GHVU01091591.1:154-597(+)
MITTLDNALDREITIIYNDTFYVNDEVMPEAKDLTRAIQLAKRVGEKEVAYYLLTASPLWTSPVCKKVEILHPFSWRELGREIFQDPLLHNKARRLIILHHDRWIDIFSSDLEGDFESLSNDYVFNIMAITDEVREIVEGCVGRSTS